MMQKHAIARAVAGARWNPRDGLIGGDQGLWLDPSDLTTMFQDSAGTTPVTAVEQFVGLIRDKSGRNNHALQSTSANRPTLSARYNLLTKTEDFSDVAWTKIGLKSFGSGSISNAIAAPDGNTTADFICEDTLSSSHSVAYNLGTSQVNTSYSTSIAIRKFPHANSRRWAYVTLLIGANALKAFRYILNIDLQAGNVTGSQVGSELSNTSYTITTEGDYWRIALTASGPSTATFYLVCGASNSATPTYNSTYGDVEYTGDGTSGIYVWGASLVPAGQSSLPYQRVNTATNYDSDATKFPWYLKFNGTSSSLQTASINFTATDKMFVSAGVRRKLNNIGMFLETSSAYNNVANNGAFALYPEELISVPKWTAGSRGTVTSARLLTVQSAPQTVAISTFMDIAAPKIAVRVNGVADSNPDTGSQGTGNFGNYPLYIGARAGTSLFFNGDLYQLVIVGRPTTVPIDQITRTEEFVNRKTRAYA